MTIHINLKLYASLANYLPTDSKDNSVSVNIADDATPYQVIDLYRVPREEAHLILLNGVYVKPDEREKPALKEGDTLAVWPPVAGG